jgi:hypothetical protein
MFTLFSYEYVYNPPNHPNPPNPPNTPNTPEPNTLQPELTHISVKCNLTTVCFAFITIYTALTIAHNLTR